MLVVDFGAQYAQLIARRVRECQVYSEIVPATMPAAEMLACKPAAIILSGGPRLGVRAGRAARAGRPARAGVPVLGICYGFQLMVAGPRRRGGQRTGGGEYGATELELAAAEPAHRCSAALPRAASRCGCRTATRAPTPPPGFTVTAATAGTPVAAVEDAGRGAVRRAVPPRGAAHRARAWRCCAGSWHAAGLPPTWTMSGVIDEQVRAIRAQVGAGRAICGLSGGVDSAVAAALVQRAIGHQLTCVFVDHGLLRQGEAEQVEQDFVAATGVELQGRRRRAGSSWPRWPGVTDPEEKRKIIGREFIRAFEQAAREIAADAGGRRRAPSSSWSRARSTRTWSSPAAAPARPTSSPTTTSAACPTTCSSSWSSRCARCSRTRSARSAPSWACRRRSSGGSRSPGPGLAIRIIGEVTAERLRDRCARPTRSPARS